MKLIELIRKHPESFMKHSKLTAVLGLVSIAYAEWFAFVLVWNNYTLEHREDILKLEILLFIASVIILLYVIAMKIIIKFRNKDSWHIYTLIRRFLSNSIGSSLLSIIYVFAFLVQLSFLCDTCLDFFVHHDHSGWNILITLLGMICIIFCFPVHPTVGEKKKGLQTMLVSGLSVPSMWNLKSFLKPFTEYEHLEKVLILLSKDVFLSCNGIMSDILEVGNRNDFNKISDDEFLKIYEAALIGMVGGEERQKNVEKDIAYRVKKDNVENWGQDGLKYCKSVNEYRRLTNNGKKELPSDTDNFQECCRDLEKLLKSQLKRMTGIKVNVDDIEFQFTDLVDYNNFEDCYNKLKKKLCDLESPEQDSVFNISPGTAVVAGVMSIMAIKGERTPVYTRQSTAKAKNKDELPELAEFNVDVFTIKELLNELFKEIEDKEVG